jgi:hypothetical protein
LRLFGRLRAGCGLHSDAASRLKPAAELPRNRQKLVLTQILKPGSVFAIDAALKRRYSTVALVAQGFSRGLFRSSSGAGVAKFGRVWQSGGMKKQGSDQQFHDRRYQERKRAEAAKKPVQQKVAGSGLKPGEEKQPG